MFEFLKRIFCLTQPNEIETTEFLFNVMNKHIYEFSVSEVAFRCYNIGDNISFTVVFLDSIIQTCRGEIIKKNSEENKIYILSNELDMNNIKKININSII
jgi:hypothetical protein